MDSHLGSRIEKIAPHFSMLFLYIFDLSMYLYNPNFREKTAKDWKPAPLGRNPYWATILFSIHAQNHAVTTIYPVIRACLQALL